MPSRFASSLFAFLLFFGAHLPVALAQVSVSLPAVSGAVNGTQPINLSVGNLGGQNVTSYQFTLTFDPAVVEFTGVDVSGTLSAGQEATVNVGTPGELTVAWAAAEPLAGTGTLLKLEARFVGEGTTALTFQSFEFNEGTPAAATQAGNVTVTGSGPTAVTISLPNLSRQLSDGAFAIPVTVNDLAGKNVTTYAFTMTYNPAIIRVDGATTNGTLSSGTTVDANTSTEGQIVLSVTSGTALTGAGTLINLQVTPLTSGSSTLALSSVTFNSGTPGANPSNGQVTISGGTSVDPVLVSLPVDEIGNVGDQILLPVFVDNITGKGINAYEFVVTYDPNILDITGVQVGGTLSASTQATATSPASGQLSVVWASATEPLGAGTLINLVVNLVGTGTATIAFSSFQFNEGQPGAQFTEGSITVSPAGDGIRVSFPHVVGAVGTRIEIPVTIGTLPDGQNITAFLFTASFDPSILQVTGIRSQGTLTEATSPTSNSAVQGQVTVAWAGVSPLAGAGTLLILEASLIGQGNSDLTFNQFNFNEGTPQARLSDGSVTVSSIGPEGRPIGVSMSQAGTGNAGGSLTLPVVVGNLSDRDVRGYAFTLNFNASVLDITGVAVNGTLSAGTQATLTQIGPGQINVTWSGSTPLTGSGVLVNLQASLLGAGSSVVSFESFVFNQGLPPVVTTDGNVTVSPSGEATVIGVSVPRGLTGKLDEALDIPILVGDVSGRNATSYSFTFGFDARRVQVTGVRVNGTVSAGLTPTVEADTEGRVTVSATSGQALSGSGTLLYVQVSLPDIGTSALNLLNFTFNSGSPSVATSNGSISIAGDAASLQFIHNVPDLSAIDIYLNGERVVDNLQFRQATSFLPADVGSAEIEVVSGDAESNASPMVSTSASIAPGAFAAVVNGLSTGTGSEALAVEVAQASMRARDENTLNVVFFQGSPDASAINLYTLDGTVNGPRALTLAENLGYGEAQPAQDLSPDTYFFEVVRSGGATLARYRADLSGTGGNALFFMVQGFVNPGTAQPNLSLVAYAPDGRTFTIPITTATEDAADELPVVFRVHGNYPNPFNPTTTVHFDLPEASEVRLEVYDILGRRVLTTPAQQLAAGREQAIRVEAGDLASGTYLYRVIAQASATQRVLMKDGSMVLVK